MSQRALLITSASFLSFTALLLLIAFIAPELPCHRERLLFLIWPVTAAIAAATFGGSFKATGSIGTIAIAASSGFAVFIVTHYLAPLPDCRKITKTDFDIPQVMLLDNNEIQYGAQGKSELVRLKAKSGVSYQKTSDPTRFVMPFIFAVANPTMSDGTVDLHVSMSGLKADDTTAWTDSIDIMKFNDVEQGSIARKFGKEAVISMLGQSGSNILPLAFIMECRNAQEMKDWHQDIVLEVVDNRRPLHTARVAKRRITVRFTKAPETLTQESCATDSVQSQ